MPTVGNTAKPTHTQEGWGLNVVNQMAQLVTMPTGGPWIITDVGVWIGGWNATPTAKVCVWDASGNLLTESAAFAVTNRGAIVLGGSDLYVRSVPGVQVAGGAQVYVGFHRHSDHPTQNGRFSSGSHLHTTGGDVPYGIGSNSTDSSGGIGAYVANYVTANQAPTAPTLTTSGTQHNGRTVLLSWIHNDPDGNPQSDAQVELRQSGVVIDSFYMNWLGQQTSQSVWRTLPSGYNADVEYQYRVRTADTGGLWGPWSALQTFRPNTKPSIPTVNAIPTNTLTPTFTGGISDPDPAGNTLVAGDVQVRRASDGVLIWGPVNPGFPTYPNPGQWSALYAGPPLAWGTQYRFVVRFQDNYGGLGSYCAWVYWTTNQPTGPDNLTPRDTATKQNTLTPVLTVGHDAAQFTDDEVEVYAANSITSTRLWLLPFGWFGSDYSARNSIGHNYAGTALTPGATYYWRARVKVGGVATAWSALFPFKINANPTAATVTIAADPATDEQTVTSGAGVLVTTDPTPRWSAPFSDPDRIPYGDAPSARSIEVRRKSDAVALAGYPITTGTAETDLLATALPVDVEHEIRVGYRDDAGWPAGSYVYSPWRTIKYSEPPTVGLTAPGAGAVVIESTPTLDWTYASAAGKAQQKFRVRVFDLGLIGSGDPEVQVHDSGEHISAATEYDVPFGILDDGHDYRWSVEITDTDGLVTELA